MLALALAFGGAALPAPPGVAGEGGAWYLVRFSDRITQADRDALEAVGARALQYYPDNSYLAWLAPGGSRLATRVPGVADAHTLAPEAKIDPHLDLTGGPRPIVATVYGARLGTALSAIERRFEVAAIHPVPGAPLQDVIVVEAPSAAPELARRPEVLYVGPGPSAPAPLDEVSDQILAGNLTGSTTSPGYEQFLQSVGLSGEGVRVSIVDTGVDPHPDLAARIVENIHYTAWPTGEPVDLGGHGTHVAGITGGNPTSFPAIDRVDDSNGFLYGLGVAPEVELVNQAALSIAASGLLCNVLWPPDYPWSRLTEDSLDAGAHIWNASWWTCENSRAEYIESARVFDMLARDGDTRAEGAQPYTFVFAAGNSGPRDSSIGSPSAAKNLITVGATVNARGGGNPNSMAGFSSRGPMADGRVGPTISAPGESIISTRSFAGALCNVPPTDSFGLYADCSGTSMAAPHVTGAVALITEWWRKSHDGADPSPAMTRALLINTATDMGAPDVPNKLEGWGRVNMGSLFDPTAQRVYEDQLTVLGDPGASATYTIAPADPAKPLRITLAWSDAPGAAGADPALVNDLDLTVTAPDATAFLGNALKKGVSVAGGDADRLNNVENVFLPTASGTYTVSVRADNLPGDGVPYSGDETDQDYALVLSNAVLVAA